MKKFLIINCLKKPNLLIKNFMNFNNLVLLLPSLLSILISIYYQLL